jgi:hypothetical protein
MEVEVDRGGGEVYGGRVREELRELAGVQETIQKSAQTLSIQWPP